MSMSTSNTLRTKNVRSREPVAFTRLCTVRNKNGVYITEIAYIRRATGSRPDDDQTFLLILQGTRPTNRNLTERMIPHES